MYVPHACTHAHAPTHTHTCSSLPVHVHQFHPLDTAESSAAHHAGSVESMSEKDMKLLLKKMERQVLALKGELKDYEWRLDQESAVSLYLKVYRFRVRARCSVKFFKILSMCCPTHCRHTTKPWRRRETSLYSFHGCALVSSACYCLPQGRPVI